MKRPFRLFAIIGLFFLLVSLIPAAIPVSAAVDSSIDFDTGIDASALGPWLFDTDGTPWIYDGTDPTVHRYAYLNIEWNPQGVGNGNEGSGGSGHASYGDATAEDTSVLNGTAGVTTVFDNYTLAGVVKTNWGIMGQAGDHRVYTGGTGVVKLNGVPVLVVNNSRITMDVSWPWPWGAGLGTTGSGWGTIDAANSDPNWVAEFDNGNGQVEYEFSTFSPVLQSYYGFYETHVVLKGAPHVENLEQQAIVAVGQYDFPAAGVSLYVNSFTNGGPNSDQNTLFVNRVLADPGGGLPPGIGFISPEVYWELSSTLDAINTDITFDLSGIAGLWGDMRVLQREDATQNWVVYPDQTATDATHITANGVTSLGQFGLGVVSHTLTIAVTGNGKVTDGGTLPYEVGVPYYFMWGSNVNVLALPDPGWQFDSWTGDVADPNYYSTYVMNLDVDKTVTANFSQIQYTLTMAVSGNGSTDPAVGDHTYDEGTVVTVTANPDPGWQFDSWTGAVADLNAANTTVTMDADKTVTANFSEIAAPTGKIVFDSTRDGNRDIYIMNADGTDQTRLTYHQADVWNSRAALSPDGTRIAFDSSVPTNSRIYVMNTDGSNPTRLTDSTFDETFPAWSPDGTRIAFASTGSGFWGIYTVNVDGTGLTWLTDTPEVVSRPKWSPDSTRIVFGSSDGDQEIYVINADGSNQTQLTNNEFVDGFPAWSPDGTRIAFESNRHGNFEIYVMDADGTNVTRLTNTPDTEEMPAWSPDSTMIAFASARDGGILQIYVMNADGSNQTRLTNNTATDEYPDWGIAAAPPTQYSLTMIVNGSGSTDPAVGDHVYDAGTVVPITATPDPGWQFAGWSDWTGYYVADVADPNSAQTTVTMNYDKSVKANFSQIAPPPTQFTLTMAKNGNGSVSPAVGAHTYADGTVVGVTAVAAPGWEFVGWTGDVANPNAASTSVTMNSDKQVTASFSEITSYTLSTSANGGGTVSPAAGTHTYAPGTVVNITATPNAGWQFSYWTGDVANAFSTSTTVTMNAHKTVIATFMQTGIPVGGEVAPVSAARVLATWLAPVLFVALAIGGGLVFRRRRVPRA